MVKNDHGLKRNLDTKPTDSQSQMRVTMEGPNVGKPRVSASVMATVIESTQAALKGIGRNLVGRAAKSKKRETGEIDTFCELFFVAFEAGSAIAVMELSETPSQTLISDLGRDSVIAFIQGMKQISCQQDNSSLPNGFDQSVLKSLDKIGPVLNHGIDRVIFSLDHDTSDHVAQYDKESKPRVRSLIGVTEEIGIISVTGRLEVLDGHNKLAATLWEPNGNRWTCIFNEELAVHLSDKWRKSVTVSGKGSIENGKNSIHVDSISTTDDEFLSTHPQGELFPFWESISLIELAVQQNVSPITDIDELSTLWPSDADPDDFLDFVLSERSKRRMNNNGGRSE